MQASVGQTEQLAKSRAGLTAFRDRLKSACDLQNAAAKALLGEATEELAHSVKLVAEAQKKVATAKMRVEVAKAAVAASGGTLSPALAAAEADLAVAMAHLAKMLRRAEIAREAESAAKSLSAKVENECRSVFGVSSGLIQQGEVRLSRAVYRLGNYLNEAFISEYVNYTPPPKTPLTPTNLVDRLQLSEPQLHDLCTHLIRTDEHFQRLVDEYRTQWKNADGDVERYSVALKARRNLSGLLGEKLVESAINPFCEQSSTQDRTYFEDGRFTKTDFVFSNFKEPLILGRGEGRFVPKGGSLAVEVKCGKKEYLLQQLNHMIFQTGGHHKADASIIFCSGDLADLSEADLAEVRKKLAESGTRIVQMLPRKEILDKICMEAIQGAEL